MHLMVGFREYLLRCTPVACGIVKNPIAFAPGSSVNDKSEQNIQPNIAHKEIQILVTLITNNTSMANMFSSGQSSLVLRRPANFQFLAIACARFHISEDPYTPVGLW